MKIAIIINKKPNKSSRRKKRAADLGVMFGEKGYQKKYYKSDKGNCDNVSIHSNNHLDLFFP